MEIYTNSRSADREVTLRFPASEAPGLSVDIFVFRDGEQIAELQEAVATPDTLDATLPLSMVQHDSNLELRWNITYEENGEPITINRKSVVEVVTPILTPEEIRAIDSDVFSTASEVTRIEKAVRHVIQAYTGQQFGHFVGTELVRGDGGVALRLPRRLLELESVDGLSGTPNFTVDPDGYIVRYFPWGVPPVKADYFGLHMHTGGVIHNPNNVRWQNWKSNKAYALKGRWGWEEVPEQVKEAAKLLVNDYACADSQYRDRYLTSMTAADWRIQFNSGAFVRTGNVRADQLLSDYVITRGWGVI